MRCIPALLWFVLLFAVASAGCGDGRTAASVSGKITVKGKPMADIQVTFQPVGGGIGSGGKTDAQGSYKLQFIDNQQDGAVPGKHQVTFQDLLDQPAESSDAGPAPPSKSRLPIAARGAIQEFVVPKEGTTSADFDLK